MITKKRIGTSAVLALMALAVISSATILASPALASLPFSHQNASEHKHFSAKPSGEHEAAHSEKADQRSRGYQRLNLTLGQTLSFSSSVGRYVNVASESQRGNASGSVTFTVTGVFAQGYLLSVTSGTITIGNSTFTISGGLASIGGKYTSTVHGTHISGQGQAANGVQYLIHARLMGNAGSATITQVMLDLQSGSTEYMVGLKLAQPHS